MTGGGSGVDLNNRRSRPVEYPVWGLRGPKSGLMDTELARAERERRGCEAESRTSQFTVQVRSGPELQGQGTVGSSR